jgi:hypothetical protein
MVLSYKNYRWLYEREWRMFEPPGKARYGDKACVSRIYLGSRIDAGKRNKIIRDKYSITFEPVCQSAALERHTQPRRLL